MFIFFTFSKINLEPLSVKNVKLDSEDDLKGFENILTFPYMMTLCIFQAKIPNHHHTYKYIPTDIVIYLV